MHLTTKLNFVLNGYTDVRKINTTKEKLIHIVLCTYSFEKEKRLNLTEKATLYGRRRGDNKLISIWRPNNE